MTGLYAAYAIDSVVPLADHDYCWFVRDGIRRASRRIWVSMFAIDIRRAYDPRRDVRSLLLDLRRAAFRGVDVRVLTGDSVRTVALREMNMVARMFLRMNGVPTRQYAPVHRSSMHDKYVLFDSDLAVIGSHNWLDESFNHASETSVAITSTDLTRKLETSFLEAWRAPSRKKAPAAAKASMAKAGRTKGGPS